MSNVILENLIIQSLLFISVIVLSYKVAYEIFNIIDDWREEIKESKEGKSNDC